MNLKRNSNESSEPLVILTGPTAVGKTALSVKLAQRAGGEIISADSMQVYRGMDIGSAKVTEEEKENVPHHLIDVCDPSDAFNVVTFASMAKQAAGEIRERGHLPIIAGGTGFYIQALLYDIDFTQEEGSSEYRNELEKIAAEDPSKIDEMLREADPASAELIHPNNLKRRIRALEFFHETGTRISEHNEEQHARKSPYNFLYFVLTDDREKLYERIDRRVDIMMENGLVEEVKRLAAEGCTRDMVSMQGIGYKEILDYLDGKCTLEEAVYIIKRDSRHFAKRQLTWFRREKEVVWIDRQLFKDDEEILAFMLDTMKQKHIID